MSNVLLLFLVSDPGKIQRRLSVGEECLQKIQKIVSIIQHYKLLSPYTDNPSTVGRGGAKYY